jgi:hypothetical protein
MVAALALYGLACLRNPDEYRFLDAVDLPIHETGHLVFAPFGEFLQFLGGSIFQLVVPIAFVLYFRHRRDGFAASVVLFWVAQNFWNIARYVGDARARELPLVGGGEHDWAYLLGSLGWLRHDQTLSASLRVIGFIVFAVSIWFAWQYSGGGNRDAAHGPGGARHLSACTPEPGHGTAPVSGATRRRARQSLRFHARQPPGRSPRHRSSSMLATRQRSASGSRSRRATSVGTASALSACR